MAKSVSYSSDKKYAMFVNDTLTRGFNEVVRSFKAMYESGHKQLLSIMREDALAIDMFDIEYIKKNLPGRLNDKGGLCTLKKYTNEEWSDLCTAPADADDATKKDCEIRAKLYKKQLDKYYVVVYFPIYKFSASQVYGLVLQSRKNADKTASEAKAKSAPKKESNKSK